MYREFNRKNKRRATQTCYFCLNYKNGTHKLIFTSTYLWFFFLLFFLSTIRLIRTCFFFLFYFFFFLFVFFISLWWDGCLDFSFTFLFNLLPLFFSTRRCVALCYLLINIIYGLFDGWLCWCVSFTNLVKKIYIIKNIWKTCFLPYPLALSDPR